MAYDVRLSKDAEKQIAKMDVRKTKQITDWIVRNLQNCNNPRRLGKPLSGKWKGMWGYRVGDYRLVCDIQDGVCVILVVTAGHRREVYR